MQKKIIAILKAEREFTYYCYRGFALYDRYLRRKAEEEIMAKFEKALYTVCPFLQLSAHEKLDKDLASILLELYKNSLDKFTLFDQNDGEIRTVLSFTGPDLSVRVVDNGRRIPWLIKRRIYRAGFTTKRQTLLYENAIAGNGLGLAQVKESMAEHQGSISFVNLPHRGVEFMFQVPI